MPSACDRGTRYLEDRRGFLDAPIDVFLVHLAQFQTECHVVVHRHVRIQGIVLEHHRDVAVLRLDVIDERLADVHLTFGDLFETGNHPQDGGLTATGRTHEDEELAILDVEVNITDGAGPSG